MLPPEERVRRFWQWFSTVARDLGANFESPHIVDELDRRVATLGGVTWELGPGLQKENALVISPGGNPQLIELARGIVSLAPPTPHWEFHAARPPKQWDLRFVVEGQDGKPVNVDANGWKYVLLSMPDGIYDLLVRAPSLEGQAPDTRQRAVDVAVEGILGETQRLERIGAVEVVSEFNDVYQRKASPIKELANHLRSLTAHRPQDA